MGTRIGVQLYVITQIRRYTTQEYLQHRLIMNRNLHLFFLCDFFAGGAVDGVSEAEMARFYNTYTSAKKRLESTQLTLPLRLSHPFSP